MGARWLGKQPQKGGSSAQGLAHGRPQVHLLTLGENIPARLLRMLIRLDLDVTEQLRHPLYLVEDNRCGIPFQERSRVLRRKEPVVRGLQIDIRIIWQPLPSRRPYKGSSDWS